MMQLLAASRIESQTRLTDIAQLPGVIFRALLIFLPAVATIYLIFSGYRYIIAQGNPELIEKAKKSLTYAVYGVVLAYASAAIILTVGSAFNFKAFNI